MWVFHLLNNGRTCGGRRLSNDFGRPFERRIFNFLRSNGARVLGSPYVGWAFIMSIRASRPVIVGQPPASLTESQAIETACFWTAVSGRWKSCLASLNFVPASRFKPKSASLTSVGNCWMAPPGIGNTKPCRLSSSKVSPNCGMQGSSDDWKSIQSTKDQSKNAPAKLYASTPRSTATNDPQLIEFRNKLTTTSSCKDCCALTDI